MARRPRLFISHSTPDLAKEIAAELEADYEILLDRTALEAGGDWRSTLNVWIGTCDAAVIMITPESIASPFCQYEWALLSYRHKQYKLPLVPIYHGSVPKEIAGRADQICAISGIGSQDFASKAKIARKVKELLSVENLNEHTDGQIVLLATYLQSGLLNDSTIDVVANDANLHLGAWNLTGTKWSTFALKLMGLGIAGGWQALRKLQPYFVARQEIFNEVFDLIAFCSWLDVSAVEQVKCCAKGNPRGPNPIGLNAKEPRTANCYILRASGLVPSKHWKVATALDAFADYPHLEVSIQEALKEALDVDSPGTERLKARLDARRALNEPIFVILEADGLDPRWIQKLLATPLFNGVSFLVLAADAGKFVGLLEPDAWLKPPLPPKLEDEVWNNYEEAKAILA
ncbi:toll/interleukin-1 receptor domain-containing protein [Dongia sp.]|uniref:toll/interleukin-1 receptor domain-containing protein n=1 Tax=Dongia sp. TaxID=1977262 RepID=UPI0035B26D5D